MKNFDLKKNKLLQEIERTNQKQKRSTEYNVIHSDSLDMNVQRGASYIVL